MRPTRHRLSTWLLALFLPLSLSLQSCAKEPDMPSQTDSVKTDIHTESIVLGMGCFWGAEKRLSEVNGVVDVESGYAGGDNKTAGYKEVLGLERAIQMGRSTERNHSEVIKVTYNPALVSLETLLITFWESHNPTQGDRQGNDIGTNYRSAIYYQSEDERLIANKTKTIYQPALTAAGLPNITTEIALLKNYITAEAYHQDYLKKNPNGYCGLGGTGVAYPGSDTVQHPRLNAEDLDYDRQLIVFEAETCPFCDKFKADILHFWKASTPIVATLNPQAPKGWTLKKALFATPTIVLFEKGKEVSRYTGYNGDSPRFWKWLGFRLLTEQQRNIAFEQGTERAFTGSHLDETRPGYFTDPITGENLFRSDTKFKSGTGWPSFFNPVEGAITEHSDITFGMERVEVRSTSSGIHLGHVFNDGPAPSFKRYCINGNVLNFVPDKVND
ncbi:MAG: peptide-methionine (S)-S-oxide reductase MsrA [Gammaproteobacteria bacterium]|nr:peptide-methionine (S)-S-oxide reductase MsrA [Gammaproteobacteria bacterium]